jgi:prepilin-type N-terminal cleavage/methylation domain-containing protein
MKDMMKLSNRFQKRGFTLIEIIMVVVILGIVAFMAIPMVSNAADIQVRAAANRIAADIDYAKSMAITHQRSYSVVFDLANESYDIRVEPAGSGDVIDHPVNPGAFVVDFSTDANLSRVSDTSKAITFDYLGSPYHGTSAAAGNSLNTGQITLQADNFTLVVNVEPVTGYVTISGL